MQLLYGIIIVVLVWKMLGYAIRLQAIEKRLDALDGGDKTATETKAKKPKKEKKTTDK
jgi:hypothetical protein